TTPGAHKLPFYGSRAHPARPDSRPPIRDGHGEAPGSTGRSGSPMTDELTDAEWQELADLIVDSPPARIHAAVSVIRASDSRLAAVDDDVLAPHLPTVEEGVLDIGAISSRAP